MNRIIDDPLEDSNSTKSEREFHLPNWAYSIIWAVLAVASVVLFVYLIGE